MKSIVIDNEDKKYPKEAVPPGTYVRSSKWDKLGIITDSSYSEINEQRVIIYTVLYFPNTSAGSYYKNLLQMSGEMFIDDELEFDLTFYLMIPPVDMKEIEIFTPSGERI